ncbi:hypothetical protein [Streptomyces sp. NPDC010273]|uniref:hypothetical protein n=1 Tax=Streptomyces sp. NPDC010273 TaxID=3364829 RepID=UPI0036E5A483
MTHAGRGAGATASIRSTRSVEGGCELPPSPRQSNLVAFAVSALALTGCIVLGLSGRRPIRDPRLFVLRGFRVGAIAFMSQFMVVVGFFFVDLQLLRPTLGCSPLKSALTFLPVATVGLPVSQLTPPGSPPAHSPRRPQGRAAAGRLFLAAGLF